MVESFALFVVHGVGFAEIRGHHALIVAGFAGMVMVLLLVVVGRRGTPIPIVLPVMFQLFQPVIVILLAVLLVSCLSCSNGCCRGGSLCLQLLLVQVVQIAADGVQGLGVERQVTGRRWR